MTTIAVASLARTRSPMWTPSAPVRPEIGAAIFVYWRFSFAFSTAA